MQSNHKFWIVATYKNNELKRLQENLNGQCYEFYNPKISIIQQNSDSKEEFLFPGYIFIYADLKDYSKIKYTKGISRVIRFSDRIAVLDDNEIDQLKKIENKSFLNPILQKVFIGQEGTITDGPFKGSLITIASLPKKQRVNIFIHILGTKRRVTASLREIKL